MIDREKLKKRIRLEMKKINDNEDIKFVLSQNFFIWFGLSKNFELNSFKEKRLKELTGELKNGTKNKKL